MKATEKFQLVFRKAGEEDFQEPHRIIQRVWHLLSRVCGRVSSRIHVVDSPQNLDLLQKDKTLLLRSLHDLGGPSIRASPPQTLNNRAHGAASESQSAQNARRHAAGVV